MLGLTLAGITFQACKKENKVEDDGLGKLKDRVDLKMGLPGQSNVEAYLIPQPGGGYMANNIRFGDIPHKIINVVNGEPVGYVEVWDPTAQYISVSTTGPYFLIIRPAFTGSPVTTRKQFADFGTAFDDFVNGRRNADSTLKQPSYPLMDTYLPNPGGWELIERGMIVSSTASPSKMSLVPYNFIPPMMNMIE